MTKNTLQLAGILEIKGSILCRTGLHIGGNPEGYQGVRIDSPVVRDPMTGFPYIPGSSLKGKLRILVEWAYGQFGEERGSNQPCACNECHVCRVFGVGAKARSSRGEIRGPTRLVVHDAFPEGFQGFGARPTSGSAAARLEQLPSSIPFTEWKKENSLDRITSAASPRDVERIPAGSIFEMGMTYSIFEPADVDALGVLFMGMELVEKNYLGGSGSRGYGQVSFRIDAIELTTRDHFLEKAVARPVAVLPGVNDVSALKLQISPEVARYLFARAS